MNRYIDADKLQKDGWKLHREKHGLATSTFETTELDCVPTADVVEADKAQKEIDYWHDKAQSYEQTILKLALNKADVVEVVRCDQCRYFDAINNDDHGWCKLISDLPIGASVRYDNDFCSYGERAEA